MMDKVDEQVLTQAADERQKKTRWERIKREITKWIFAIVVRVLAVGPVPRHIAFIMDGNRRYAKKLHVKTIQGHTAGFYALEYILEWCMKFGVKEVSIYAFSLENYKRPQEEVDGLMNLCAEKFREMMGGDRLVERLGIRVRVIGDLSNVPEKTKTAIDEVVAYSQNNTKAVLNVCFAYTSRDEMTRAVQTLVNTAHRARDLNNSNNSSNNSNIDNNDDYEDEKRLIKLVKGGEGATVAPPTSWEEEKRGKWGEEEGTGREGQWGWEDELWKAMMITDAPELIIRTSGEIRFSDFLLWQTAFSCVVFLSVLWPDFSVWHFLYVILVYQANFKTMQARRKYYAENVKNTVAPKDNVEMLDSFDIDSKDSVDDECEEVR